MNLMLSRKQGNPVTVYEPNHIMKAGVRIWAEMFRELVAFKSLIWRLVIRDISARYKQSVVGILCAFIAPLVMMVVFIWIKSKNILLIGETTMLAPLNFPEGNGLAGLTGALCGLCLPGTDGLAPFFSRRNPFYK